MNNEFYMNEALKEAQKAFVKQEVPIGCVIVKNGVIVAKTHNLKEIENDSTYHAEMIAIRQASEKLGWRLTDCTMYVTLEPCPMCAGAIIQSRIKRLVFGTRDEKGGAVGSKLNLLGDYKFNHEVEVTEGILGEECRQILQKFFKELRSKKYNFKEES